MPVLAALDNAAAQAQYLRLPGADRKELQGHIQVFLAEKHLEGCGGLELTEEMKVCIAGQACLRLLHRDTDYYPNLRSVLVYPTTYFVQTTRHVGSGVMEERRESRLGEAWDCGAVVLAWDAVDAGAADPGDGHNVVFHEFAHQLDFEDGRTEGAPLLGADEPPDDATQCSAPVPANPHIPVAAAPPVAAHPH